MKSISLVLVLALGSGLVIAKEKQPASYSIPLPPKPDFSSVDWLVGEWTGRTTGKGPQGDVHLSASYDLDQRFMILREEVTLPGTLTVPASKEALMGVLSSSRTSGFMLRCFSTTGFITSYRLSTSGTDISFIQEGGDNPPPGFLFRRLIHHPDPSELIETVQVAPANSPFFEYYTAKLTRVVPARAPTAAPSH